MDPLNIHKIQTSGSGKLGSRTWRRKLAAWPVLLALACAPAAGASGQILDTMRAGDWPAAQTLAAADPDPVAGQLVTYLRIINASDSPYRPAAATIAAFIDTHPTWPDQPLLARRLAESLSDTPNLNDRRTLCVTHKPSLPAALASCAEAEAWAGHAPEARALARDAWTAGLAGEGAETDFSARWSAAITAEDQWARFQHLATDDDAAGRQFSRLDPPHRRAAEARLAFRHDDPNALAILAAVPPALRSDPALLLDEARSLRRGQLVSAASALWQGAAVQAEAQIPQASRPAWWSEREILARKLLAAGDPASALTLADDRTLTPDQAGDSLFLAGWILLRRLHDAPRATDRFSTLAQSSHSAITTARAHYWLARAAQAQGATLVAASEYRLAAAWPATFYGQHALAALGEDAAPRIEALADPATTAAQRAALGASDLARAAAKLTAWGDQPRARAFLVHIGRAAQTPQDFAAAASLAASLGLPDAAIQIARLAGKAGVVLPQTGWPTPFIPLAVETDQNLALGLIRQESSFDPQITSAAGARGLMQLMPQTARETARTLGANAPDLADPDQNMRLGTRYFATLLQQFGGVVPYAVAAYNAGPHRVRDWIAANGDAARQDEDSMIDWIELIPFNETRNYVQRVLENAAIYRARRAAER